MYEAFYNLSDDPFRLLPDPGICFPHQSCAKAWAYLRYAVKRGEGIVVVTGPPGSGKTTLSERLLRELNPAKTVSIRLIANDLNAADLLRRLAYAFGLPAEGMDRAMLAHRIERYLIELEHSSRRALVIIDEAQTLSHQSLEAMRLLTDLQSRSRPVLQLILLGQEELEGVMCAPGMEQFQHRVIASCRLHTMDLAETKAYLEYRLTYADWRGDPSINGPAVMAIYRHSKGLPRHINKICSRLLLHGCTEEKHTLSDRDVQGVVRDLQSELLSPVDGTSEAQVDRSRGVFDSVYELALVPNPTPAAAKQRASRDALAALYLSDDIVPPSEFAGSRQTPDAGGGQGWHESSKHYAGYGYLPGRRRPRGLRRRLGYPYRLVRRGTVRGLAMARDSAPQLLRGLWDLRASLTPQLQHTSQRLHDWAGDLDQRARTLYAQANRQQIAVAASLAGFLVIGVSLLVWNAGPTPYDASDGGMASRLPMESGDLLVEDGVLNDSTRYLEIASQGRERLGGSLALARALKADSVESLAALLIQGQVRLAQVAEETGGAIEVSGMGEGLSQPLLGRVISDVTGLLLGRSLHARSSLNVWTLARDDADSTVSGHEWLGGPRGHDADTADAAPADTAQVAVGNQKGKESSDEQIALLVAHEQNAVLDYVRFLPAPATGGAVQADPGPPGLAAKDDTDEKSEDRLSSDVLPEQAAVDSDTADAMRVGGSGADMPIAEVVAAPDEDLQRVATLAVSLHPADARIQAAASNDIDRLLTLGDEAFAKDRLLLPEDESAYTYYRRVLAVDEQNEAAREGMARIVQRYGALASGALGEQAYDLANRYLDRALRIDPGNAEIRALRKRVATAVAQAEALALAQAEAEAEARAAAAQAAAERERMAAEARRAELAAEAKKNQLSNFQQLMRFVNGQGDDVAR